MSIIKGKIGCVLVLIMAFHLCLLADENIALDKIKQLKEDAISGNTRACLELGNDYFFGNNVQRDACLAFQYYYKAAVNNNHEAEFNLAICYEQGYGVKQNKLAAFEWYRKAAKGGIVQAKFNLAVYYRDGATFDSDPNSNNSAPIKLDKNIDAAISLFQEAGKAGFAPALRELAKIYMERDVLNRDIKKGVEILKLAVDKGDPEAMYLLADYYVRTDYSDKKIILDLVKTAAENNIPRAMETLGAWYECGKGVQKNYDTALTLYTSAAKAGLASAQTRLGDYYLNGTHVKEDINQAKFWYKNAAEQSDASSLYMLGVFADQGIAEPVNKKLALQYFLKSANLGYPKAEYNIGVYYANGIGVNKNLYSAFYWYRKAALQNDPMAQRELGLYYLSGVGGKTSYNNGLNWLDASEASGDATATTLLNDISLH